MSLNPIVALTDKFEKLITEHGSATIQSKHIALLKDQFAILEKENAKLNTALEQSEAKNKVLKSENVNLKKGNSELKKKIESNQKPSHDASLIKEQDQILIFLAQHYDQAFPLESIMAACNLSHQKALYHLEQLEEDMMIGVGYKDHAAYWHIDTDGRAYLAENGMLP